MRTTDPNHINLLGSNVSYWIFHDDKPQTIVMVHGFRGNHHGLHDIIRMLPNYRIIIPDLPGFGESTPMDAPHNIENYTAFITEFIKHCGVQRPALLGHSFGSIIAASVAASAPELISKLILINPIATPALKGPQVIGSYAAKLYYRVGAALPERAGRKLLSNKLIVRATSELLAKTKDKALRADIHRHHLEHFSSFQTRQALLEAFDTSIEHTATEFAPRITSPTLLIAGSIDDIAPLKGQYELKRQLPDARLVVVDDVEHLIHREAPKQAGEAITDFLG